MSTRRAGNPRPALAEGDTIQMGGRRASYKRCYRRASDLLSLNQFANNAAYNDKQLSCWFLK